MKYIAAYLLASLGGDASKDKVNKILSSVAINVDAAALDAIFAKVDGKDVAALIAEGSSKLAVVGGGAGGAVSGGAAAGGAAEKKEEAKPEEEEVGMTGGFDDLFG